MKNQLITTLSKKLAIVGFPKCGTVSLEHFLKAKFGEDNVIRITPELTWMNGGSIKFYKNYHPKYRPVIITRNQEDMLRSAYHYYPSFHRYPFDDFKKTSNWKDYAKEIRAFVTFDPIVLSLEEMQKNPQFPHMNRGTYH